LVMRNLVLYRLYCTSEELCSPGLDVRDWMFENGGRNESELMGNVEQDLIPHVLPNPGAVSYGADVCI
jgi:hypothetical protein